MKMKKARILAFLAAASLAATSLGASMTAFAANPDQGKTDPHTVTIEKPTDNDKATHQYEAYQLFKGELTNQPDGSKVMTEIEWGDNLPAASVTKLESLLKGQAVEGFTADAAITDLFKPATEFDANFKSKNGDDALVLDAAKVAKALSTIESDSEAAQKLADLFNKVVDGDPKKSSGAFTGLTTGYYLFKDKDGSLAPTTDNPDNQTAYTDFILKVVDDVTVKAKADVPTIDKNILVGEDKKKADTASIGDKIQYQVDTFIPDMQGYNKYFFIVNDTMCKGLTFNDDVAIKIKDTENGDQTLTKGTDYTVSYKMLEDDPTTTDVDESGQTAIEIVFKNFIQNKGNEYNYNKDDAGTYYKLTGTKGYTTIDPNSYDSTDTHKYKNEDNAFVVDDENGTYYKLTTGEYTNIAKADFASTTDKYKKENKPIEITYSATLNENCDRTALGNENNVDLTFSNNPNHNYTGDTENGNPDKPGPSEPTGKTPKSNTKVYTTGIRIRKVDEKNKPLTGAKFKLSGTGTKAVITQETKFTEDASGTFYKLTNGTYTQTAPVVNAEKPELNTINLYEQDGEGKALKFKQETGTDIEYVAVDAASNEVEASVDSDGYLVFSGLGAGEYTLVETVAPTGYNLDSTEQKIVIGNVENKPDLDGPGWTVKDGDKAVVNVADTALTEDNNYTVITKLVINKKGIILPATGGIGTVLFYVIGSALIAGAGVLFVTKKRKTVKEK